MKKPVELIKGIDLPLKNPTSIAWDKDGLWVSDVEDGNIYLISVEDGTILKTISSGVRRPQTLSRDNDFLWIYDELTQLLYKKDLESGSLFHYGAVEGLNRPYLGIASKDDVLYLTSPDQPEFTCNNNHISVVKFPRRIKAETYRAPSYSCRGLFRAGRYLWTLDIENNELFVLDPATGTIQTSYDIEGCEIPSSLVVTDDRIYMLDLARNKLMIYKLDIFQKYQVSNPRKSEVEIIFSFHNGGPGVIEEMEFTQSIPFASVNQDLLTEVEFIPEADQMIPCQWNEDKGIVGLHKIRNLKSGSHQDVTMKFQVETRDLKYYIYPHRCETLDSIPGNIREKYLFSELENSEDKEVSNIMKMAQILFETEAKEIKAKVEEVLDGEKNPFWIAKKLYDYVIDNIGYILPYSSLSSKKILSQGKGSCGNHATFYIALCQAAGLPARSIIGFAIWKDDSRLGYLDHEIPQVYLPNYGWVPVDTSRFMALPLFGSEPILKFRSFGTLSNRFFMNGFGRDMTSEFARYRHRNEPLIKCSGQTNPTTHFFMRWKTLGIGKG